MTSRPTKMKDPMTATYSVLSQDVRGLNGTPGRQQEAYMARRPRNGTGIVVGASWGLTAQCVDRMRKTRGMIVAGGASMRATLCDCRRS